MMEIPPCKYLISVFSTKQEHYLKGGKLRSEPQLTERKLVMLEQS